MDWRLRFHILWFQTFPDHRWASDYQTLNVDSRDLISQVLKIIIEFIWITRAGKRDRQRQDNCEVTFGYDRKRQVERKLGINIIKGTVWNEQAFLALFAAGSRAHMSAATSRNPLIANWTTTSMVNKCLIVVSASLAPGLGHTAWISTAIWYSVSVIRRRKYWRSWVLKQVGQGWAHSDESLEAEARVVFKSWSLLMV